MSQLAATPAACAAPRRIAVVGAGIAGLTAAAQLRDAGHAVTLFDKSGKVGGRCATRRSAAGAFDHGAPNFVARSAAFRAQVLAWRDDGLVAVGDDAEADLTASLCGYGVPSMNALPQRLAAQLLPGVTLHCDSPVSGLKPAGAPALEPAWQLRLADGSSHPAAFDAVVVALPAEQAAVLLQPDAAMADAMRATHSAPCWTVMAAWGDALPGATHSPRAADTQQVLATVLRDDTRRGRTQVDGVACRRVLHATAQWTHDHLEADAAEVIRALLGEFARLQGVRLATPVHAAAHRWRYAQVTAPRAETCAWNATLRLGACGDAWHGVPPADAAPDRAADGIERAWLSGRALAHQMHRTWGGS